MDKEETITKKYFDAWTESNRKEIRQHMIDLTSGFREEIKVVGNQVDSLDEKLTRLDQRVSIIDTRLAEVDDKVTKLQDDVTLIKDVFTEKTDKIETQKLEKRVSRLELKVV